MADELKKGQVVGADPRSAMARALAKKFPDLADTASAKMAEDQKLYKALKAQADALLDIEMKRKKLLADTNVSYEPDMRVVQQVQDLQNQMQDILLGVSPAEVARMTQQAQLIDLGEEVRISEQQLIGMLEDQSRAKTAFDSLIQAGKGKAANALAEMISENLEGQLTNVATGRDTLSPATIEPTTGQPVAETPTEPLAVGGGSPIENIRTNIRNVLSRGTRGAVARVGRISSALKSQINRRAT